MLGLRKSIVWKLILPVPVGLGVAVAREPTEDAG